MCLHQYIWAFKQLTKPLNRSTVLDILMDEMTSPMPTCASKIMLTSLAPSPMARVMGCSLEALISFTICRKQNPQSLQLFVIQDCALSISVKWSAVLSPVLSAVVPCDSRAQRYSCDRSLEKFLCSCRARLPPGWASVLQTEWPHRWSDRNRGSRLTTWNTISQINREPYTHHNR